MSFAINSLQMLFLSQSIFKYSTGNIFFHCRLFKSKSQTSYSSLEVIYFKINVFIFFLPGVFFCVSSNGFSPHTLQDKLIIFPQYTKIIFIILKAFPKYQSLSKDTLDLTFDTSLTPTCNELPISMEFSLSALTLTPPYCHCCLLKQFQVLRAQQTMCFDSSCAIVWHLEFLFRYFFLALLSILRGNLLANYI